MTRRNVPLITLLVLSLAAPLAGCDATARFTEQEHIERAKEADDKGDLKGSIIELKNAIQKNPDSAEARLLLGHVYLRTGQGAEAEKELTRAQKLGVNQEAIKPALGEALVMMGEYDRVLDEIQAGGQTSPINRARIFQIRADALFRQGRVQEACDLYRQSLDVDKSNPPTYWGLAQCAATDRNLAQAREWLDQALALKSHQAKTWTRIGDWERLRLNSEAAMTAYNNALKADPNSVEARHSRAILYMALGKFDAAQDDVDRVARLAPKSVSSLYLKALFDFERKKYAQAREGLQELFRLTEAHPPSLLLAGATDYELGSYEQADAHLTRYLARAPGHPYARRLHAATLIQQRAADRALDTLAPLLGPGSLDVQALVLAGEAYRIKRQPAQAAEYLARAAAIDPQNATLKTQLGFSHLAAGEPQLGLAELSKAASLEPDTPRANIALIAALIDRREYDKALAAIPALEKQLGKNPLPHVLRGRALLGKNDLAGARKSFELAVSIAPDHYPAAANLAQLDMRDKRPDAARARFEKVLAHDKTNLQAMLALAEIAENAKDTKTQVSWLEKAAKAHPEAIGPRTGLVKHLLATNAPQKALAVANEAVNLNPDKPAALELLGSVMLAMDDVNGAISTFSKVVRLSGQSPEAHVQLALVQIRGNKLTDARNTLATALKLRPGHAASLDAQVRLEMSDKKPDAALRIARQLQTSQPKSPLGFEREGDIQIYLRQPALAAKAYDQALARNANSALLVKSHRAHVQAGSPGAEAQLKTWLAKYPQDTFAHFYAAEHYAAAKRDAEAIAAYETLLRHSPEHASALNNLANLYYKAADKRALPTAEKAFKISPESPAILDTLGWILVGQGQPARGLPLIDKALAKLPGNATLRYHRAIALASTGNKARARAELEALLRETPAFPEAEAAKAQLRKL